MTTIEPTNPVPAEPIPVARVTQYSVSCLPESHPENWHMSIRVESRGDGNWSVSRDGYCFNAKGDESYEPLPSSRTPEFLAEFRHDRDTALELAYRLARNMTLMGKSVTEVLAFYDEKPS